MKRLAAIEAKEFSYAVGKAGTGLWNPGSCYALLIACDWAGEFLGLFADALPTNADLPPNVELRGCALLRSPC